MSSRATSRTTHWFASCAGSTCATSTARWGARGRLRRLRPVDRRGGLAEGEPQRRRHDQVRYLARDGHRGARQASAQSVVKRLNFCIWTTTVGKWLDPERFRTAVEVRQPAPPAASGGRPRVRRARPRDQDGPQRLCRRGGRARAARSRATLDGATTSAPASGSPKTTCRLACTDRVPFRRVGSRRLDHPDRGEPR